MDRTKKIFLSLSIILVITILTVMLIDINPIPCKYPTFINPYSKGIIITW